jgi:hypothetical protein
VGEWGLNLGQDRLLSRYLVLSPPPSLNATIGNHMQIVEQCTDAKADISRSPSRKAKGVF